MSLAVPNNNTLLNATLSASNSSSVPDTPKSSQKSSWFSRLLDRIPGVKWLKPQICRGIYGPTYGLRDVELREYKIAQIREERIESKRQEREAEFMVAKFMAGEHPQYYWHKYIDAFETGSEERKRGVLLFILMSKELYGHYYGRNGLFKRKIERELTDMGIQLDGKIELKEYTEEGVGAASSRLKARDITPETLQITGSDRKMFENLKKVIEGLDVSHLRDRHENQKRQVNRSRRTYRVWEEQDILRPNFE
jgi:hypothetical protein